MPWRRQARSAGRLASAVIVVALLVGAGVLGITTLLGRGDKAASTQATTSSLQGSTTSVPTNPGSATSGRPPGLVQAGDSKTACIYPGDTLGQTLLQSEQATGLTYNCIETYSDVEPNWADWVAPWVILPQYGYRSWLAADPRHRTVILTQQSHSRQ